MTSLEDLTGFVPPEAIEAWPKVAEVCPDDGILMGGTALTVHLHHRLSRDLDIFTTERFDADDLELRLRSVGSFATTTKDEGTLNGVLGATKVQFLWARDQQVLEQPTVVSGLAVGSVSDIFATKPKVIGDRGELRDYFDLMRIEKDTGRVVEEGLQLLAARYGHDRSGTSIEATVRGLGYFDDVTDDPYLAEVEGADLRDRIVAYWTARQPQIVASLDPRGAVTFFDRVALQSPEDPIAL